MDKDLREKQRRVKAQGAVDDQQALAKAHWRAGQLLLAYDLYVEAGLLAKRDPEALALAKEMAELQRPVLEALPASWNFYRCYPGWPPLRSSVQVRGAVFDRPIDTVCVDFKSQSDERERLAALPFLRGIKWVRDQPEDWTEFQESPNLERLWLFFHNSKNPLKQLETLPKVRHLKLFCDTLSEESVKTICDMAELRELTLFQEGHTVEQLRPLQSLQSLTQFTLALNEFNPKRLEHILALTPLTHLYMPHCSLQTEQFESIKALPRLQALSWGDDETFQKTEPQSS